MKRWYARIRIALVGLLAATVTVLSIVALSGSPANAASAVVSGYGSLSVQLATGDGAPLALSGVEVAATTPRGAVSDGYTNASGVATLGQLYGPNSVTLSAEAIPQNGDQTYAPLASPIAEIVPGATAHAEFPMSLGATVSGNLVGPTSAVESGKTVVALSESAPYPVFQTTSDASGHYEFVGLSGGVYTIEGYATETAEPAQWKALVVQQHGSTPASHVTSPMHFLHTTYDLRVGVESAGGLPDATLSGATVRVVGSSGAVVAEQRVSTVLDSQQLAQFEISSGSYRLELVTTSAPGRPSRNLWLAGTAYHRFFTLDVANADAVAVTFGYVTNLAGPVPG